MYFGNLLESFINIIIQSGFSIEMDIDGILSCVNINNRGRLGKESVISCKICHPHSGRHDDELKWLEMSIGLSIKVLYLDVRFPHITHSSAKLYNPAQ